ncbi:MAG: NMD3-related protein [Methanosarcinales archaeon]|nr:NMD3-related protein [Methanosarcinales archaeon]
MNNVLCPVCGRPSEQQIDGRCKDCFLRTITLASIPQVVRTIICPVCAAVKKGKHWEKREREIEDLIHEGIEQALNIDPQAHDVSTSITLSSSNPAIHRAHITITADIKGVQAQSQLYTEVRISKETCDACSRMAGGYYEAVIQIRAEGRFPDKDEQQQMLELVEEIVKRQYMRGDTLSFITNIQELPEGTDVYLGSNNTARQAVRTAVERFGCRYSESPSLAGKKDGKDIYRITYSLRLPRLVPGDIIKVGENMVLVKRSGKMTTGMYLESGLEFSEHTDRLKDAHKVSGVKEAGNAVVVSVEQDTVQVMHPSTFKQVTIKKPAHFTGTGGEDVRVIPIEDRIFILP